MGLSGYGSWCITTHLSSQISKCSLKLALFTDSCPRQRDGSPRRARWAPMGTQLRSDCGQGGLWWGGTAAQGFGGLVTRSGGMGRWPAPPTPVASVSLVFFCGHHREAQWVEAAPSKSSPREVPSVFSFSFSFSVPPPRQTSGASSGLRVGCSMTYLAVRVIAGCQLQKGPESHTYLCG